MSRPSSVDMLKAIDATLASILPGDQHSLAGSGSRTAAGDDDVFECFLLFEILGELNRNGAGNFQAFPAGSPIDFKRGPGDFKSTPSAFSYLTFDINKRSYEAHISTFVQTRAIGAVCELDVAVFDSAVRPRHPADPTYRNVKLFIEAKYYANSIDLAMAREFVGLCHRMCGSKCFGGFVSCCGVDTSARALITGGRYSYSCFESVTPASAGLGQLQTAVAAASSKTF